MCENIEIRKADETEKETVMNLYQLYSYDFSSILQSDVSKYGLYTGCKHLDEYFTEEGRNLYIIHVDGNIAGFVMMNIYTLVLPIGTNSIAEFFIMQKYRRKKVGTYVANYILDKYPGRMEIRVLKRNEKAVFFWDKVILDRNIKEHKIVEMSKDNKQWIVHDISVEKMR